VVKTKHQILRKYRRYNKRVIRVFKNNMLVKRPVKRPVKKKNKNRKKPHLNQLNKLMRNSRHYSKSLKIKKKKEIRKKKWMRPIN
jgi:hypothetical protein